MIMFNIHDLILFAVLTVCGLLAIFTLNSKVLRYQSRHLLVAFLAMNSLIALDTLFYWGDGVRPAIFEISPWLLTIFSVAVFVFGPVLYGLIRYELYGRNAISWHFAFHFIPAILTPLYLYWVCYRYPLDIQRELILNLSIYSLPDSYFDFFTLLKKSLPVIYGVMCSHIVYKNYWRIKLQAKPSQVCSASIEIVYLLYLAVGFTLIRLWIFITHWSGLYLLQSVSDLLGIIGNYLTLGLLLGLAWLSIKYNSQKESAQDPADYADAEAMTKLMELKSIIQNYVDEEKPFLNSQLTLHRFAGCVGLSERQVSLVINKVFEKNFQDFINYLRVQEAIRLLQSPVGSDKTIMEVAGLAGFNSKASFNRLFKKYTHQTPSAYKAQFS